MAQRTTTGAVTLHDGSFTVKAYRGDACVLIAMDLDEHDCDGLAGFAIARSADDGKTWSYAPNRLSFEASKGISSGTDPNAEIAGYQPSNVAPYQKFHWVDFPPEILTTPFHYRIEARYFVPGKDPASGEADALQTRYSVSFAIQLGGDVYPNFNLGFTRGYISSQAFAERWPQVRALRPSRSVQYDTNGVVPKTKPPTTWREMYRWLGARARMLLSDFLARCEHAGHGYDIFAYDLDEPDFIKVLARDARAGRRVRMILDNSSLHTKSTALEPKAAALLKEAGVTILRGHFRRYAHDKCIIERDEQGQAIRVLTGSANFSVRGLYVQSNSVIVIDDPQVAVLYGQAFDEAWSDMAHFASSPVAAKWFDAQGTGIPPFSVSFAPHANASVSLDRVAQAINNAKSSVLFAVMELGGGGDVLHELLDLQKRTGIFSYGVTQTTNGLKFYKSGQPDGLLVPFAYLKAHVPEPFRAEWSGGEGQVIHHKFVVIDFNGTDPQVFCGSSNLAKGGEESNGDNLLAITDPAIATLYAVEAIKLVDHYEFRALASTATTVKPLLLQGPKATPPWWQSAYDASQLKYRERLLFAGTTP